MKEQISQCSCGATLDIKSAKGLWIQCPSCGTKYLVESLVNNNSTNNEQNNETFFFLPQCNLASFRRHCFKKMLLKSPADIFTSLRIKKVLWMYLPYKTNIGGEYKSNYNAYYVGTAKYSVLKPFVRLIYWNDDEKFGTLSRKQMPEKLSTKCVDVNPDFLAKIPKEFSAIGDLYYYPFFCLLCEYKGKLFTFSSMGDNDIKTEDLPEDKELRQKPEALSFSQQQIEKYARKIGLALFVLALLCLTVVYAQEIGNFFTSLQKHWANLEERFTWIAYLIILLFLIIAFGAGALVTYTVLVVLSIPYAALYRVAIKIVDSYIKTKNAQKLARWQGNVNKIQSKMKEEAKSLFGVELD